MSRRLFRDVVIKSYVISCLRECYVKRGLFSIFQNDSPHMSRGMQYNDYFSDGFMWTITFATELFPFHSLYFIVQHFHRNKSGGSTYAITQDSPMLPSIPIWLKRLVWLCSSSPYNIWIFCEHNIWRVAIFHPYSAADPSSVYCTT